MKTSLKHLIRTPVKTLLFFLLITACTVFLVMGASLLVQANAQIEAAKREFVTLGTVEQKPDHISSKVLYNSCLADWGDFQGMRSESLNVTTYQELVTPEMLDFEGADYVQKPVTRPNYVAYLPDCSKSFHHDSGYVEISEFTVKEMLDDKSMLVELEKILYLSKELDVLDPKLFFGTEVGEEITVCLHNQQDPQEFQVGKRYIGTLTLDLVYTPGDFKAWSDNDPRIREKRMALIPGPFSTQVNADTHLPIEGKNIPSANNLWVQDGAWEFLQPPQEIRTFTPWFSELVYADEVTDGFYEDGGRGELWLNWAEGFKRELKDQQTFPVVPVDDLQLFPSFHSKEAIITSGRAITQEEFAAGEKVCLLTQTFAAQNHLKPGDKLSLSLLYSMYGTYPIPEVMVCYFGGMCSPLNAQGQLYEPFWECEYEVVGLYNIPFDEEFTKWWWSSDYEILGGTIIIPAKSVEASDENNIAYYAPMNADHTSFIIPNGTIEEFDQKLHEAVPEAEMLNITYDDNGYTDVVASLNSAKLSGMILFLVALFASLAIIILLLYFFVTKEKKRTAVERSLGMTRRQCKVSLVAGILVLTVVGAALGSVGGAAAVEYLQRAPAQETTDTAGYDTSYSMWAQSEETLEDLLPEAPTPVGVYLAVPLAQIAAVLILSLFFAQRNLKTKPIVLLSTKEE